MKGISAIILAFVIAIPIGQAKATDQEKIIELIKYLALLTDVAGTCGEHLNIYGKKALTTKACIKFDKDFYSQWPDRETLMNEIGGFIDRVEQGEMQCDETCRVMIQRAEELRITVTYYLDYMDFMKDF